MRTSLEYTPDQPPQCIHTGHTQYKQYNKVLYSTEILTSRVLAPTFYMSTYLLPTVQYQYIPVAAYY